MQIFNDLGPASSLASERDNFLEEMADDMRDCHVDGKKGMNIYIHTHIHTHTHTYIFMCMDILPACICIPFMYLAARRGLRIP